MKGNTEGEALVDHKVSRIGQHRFMEPGNIPHEVVEAVAGDPAGSVHVDAVEGLHDLGVVGDLKVGDHRLTEALDFHIVAVVRADRDGGINDIGDL